MSKKRISNVEFPSSIQSVNNRLHLLVVDELSLNKLGDVINHPQDVLGSNLLQINSYHFNERRRLWQTNLLSCHWLLELLPDSTIVHYMIDSIYYFRANPTYVSIGTHKLLLLVIVYLVCCPDGFEGGQFSFLIFKEQDSTILLPFISKMTL